MCERRLVRLSEVSEKSLTWIWLGYLPIGAIADLSGDPGTGKSRITYDLAARITSGQPMPTGSDSSPPAGVVILQGEDTVDTMLKPTLVAAGADLNRIFIYDPKKFGDQPLTLPDDLELVGEAAVKVDAKLVIIDPTTVFFACNVNSDQSVRRALKPVANFAKKLGLAVLLVRHLVKANTGNPLHQAAGSIAWIAAARCAMRAMNDPTSSDPHRHLLVQIKSNLISSPSLAYRTVMPNGHVLLEWLGTSTFAAKDLNRAEHEEGTRGWEAAEVLFLILRDGPAPAQFVIAKAGQEGVARRTLERAKIQLRVRSERHQLQYGWHWLWRLPDEENPVLHYFTEKYAALDAESQENTLTPAAT